MKNVIQDFFPHIQTHVQHALRLTANHAQMIFVKIASLIGLSTKGPAYQKSVRLKIASLACEATFTVINAIPHFTLLKTFIVSNALLLIVHHVQPTCVIIAVRVICYIKENVQKYHQIVK